MWPWIDAQTTPTTTATCSAPSTLTSHSQSTTAEAERNRGDYAVGYTRHALCEHGLRIHACGICRTREPFMHTRQVKRGAEHASATHGDRQAGFTAPFRIPVSAMAPDKRARVLPQHSETLHASVRLP